MGVNADFIAGGAQPGDLVAVLFRAQVGEP